MFAPNCVGTANATSAGWGNLGGGVTQIVMPLVFVFFVGWLGFGDSMGWRLSMFSAGILLAITGRGLLFSYPRCSGRELFQATQGKPHAQREIR